AVTTISFSVLSCAKAGEATIAPAATPSANDTAARMRAPLPSFADIVLPPAWRGLSACHTPVYGSSGEVVPSSKKPRYASRTHFRPRSCCRFAPNAGVACTTNSLNRREHGQTRQRIATPAAGPAGRQRLDRGGV